MTRRRYSDEFKREAVALVQAGSDLKEVAQTLGVAHGSLWNWVAKASVRTKRPVAGVGEGPTGAPIDPAVYQAALRRIAELERENEFLGKASAYFAEKAHR